MVGAVDEMACTISRLEYVFLPRAGDNWQNQVDVIITTECRISCKRGMGQIQASNDYDVSTVNKNDEKNGQKHIQI